jgi:cell division inhibitor SepF
VIDLKGVEKAEGQSALDFICGVAYAMRGVVMRIAPAVFLATPKRNLVDLWEEERVEAKDHE